MKIMSATYGILQNHIVGQGRMIFQHTVLHHIEVVDCCKFEYNSEHIVNLCIYS